MQNITVIHEATREYAYPLSRNRLFLLLKCAGQAPGLFYVHWCNRFHDSIDHTQAMRFMGRDGEFGYYSCEIETGESVKYVRYYFELEGGGLYYGADGPENDRPSRCFEYLYTNECDCFAVPEWAEGAVFYQIFPERFQNGDAANDPATVEPWGGRPTRDNFFGGDLKGIVSKLDYLSDLGVDALYLNPVFLSPSNHKYDTTDYYAIDPAFGTIEDLRELVSRCHERGIRVVLDGVFNHCGYWFPPFQDVLKNGSASRWADWFYLGGDPVQSDPPNYECVGYYKWMPKIRMKTREARDYFLRVGTWWMEQTGIDGWRLDVADEVDFTFWQEFRRVIKAVREDAILIGETWKDGRNLLRGDQMDSVMNYLFRDAAVRFFAERSIDAERFDQLVNHFLAIYPKAAVLVLYNLIGSHDTPRFLTLCGGDRDAMKLAVAFQMTFPGAPAVYYGDELAMTGDNDPDCRKTMDWERGDGDMHAFFRTMIRLRREQQALRRGDFRSILCQGGVYCFARTLGDEAVYVVINNSDDDQTVAVPAFQSGPLRSLISGGDYMAETLSGTEPLTNSDIHGTTAQFKVALRARHFEIIKQGGVSG